MVATLLLVVQVLLASCLLFTSSFTNAQTTRSFTFEIDQRYAALSSSLPHHTAIYNKYPREDLRHKLPKYLSIAAMKEDESKNITESSYILMGRPIHAMQNDRLEFNIINKLQSTGLSIHFHGFEMTNNVHYDGVVGLTQCPISPKTSFNYNFVIKEEPGTYWYHTHSGNLGIDSHNYIKGPLIVHPDNGEYDKSLVDSLNNHEIGTTTLSSLTSSKTIINYKPLLSYANQRIIFFSDGHLKSDALVEMYNIGGLNPPVQENDDGFIAASMEYEFGTINGKLREIIHVQKSTKYTFRLINGGVHFPFRFSIDSIDSFSIVSSDATPTIPYYGINEIILHNAERYDIEVEIPADIPNGSRYWIRVDTLESRKHGYENGIRAILHVVDDISTVEGVHDNDILDPEDNIKLGKLPVEERVTMNCYSQLEKKMGGKNHIGDCLPITALRARRANAGPGHRRRSEEMTVTTKHAISTVIRTVDFDVSPPPMHAHFVRIDYDNWYQHVGSSTHHFKPDFDASKDLHPHSAIMNVPSFTPVIIIWRSQSLMDHPMHLHGYKMEILEIFVPDRERDCNLAKCELSDIFNSTEKIEELDAIVTGSRPVKDTFIMPAGGAVVTRIFTREPAPWLAHCHMEVHREDGMAFVLNVGDYFPPSDDSWLPDDFPDCDTAFLQSHQHEEAYCDCFIDEDAVLGLTLDPTYKCSRSYLCIHEKSQVAVLTSENGLGGFKIQSNGSFPGWAISLIIVCFVALITIFFAVVLHKIPVTMHPKLVKSLASRRNRASMRSITVSDTGEKPNFWLQFTGLVYSQWSEYRPGSVNVLRVVEVVGLGVLGGILFQDVGNNSSATGFGEKTSLLFFSSTLWSQTRMYPAIGNYFEWTRKDYLTFKHKQYDILPVFLSRMVVVNACEAWWPFLFALCAYPLAAMFGDVGAVFTIGFLLALNNICYIALGGLFGTLLPTVSLSMIGATLFAQTTVICAGFFTELPRAVGWIRFISPIFYAFKGIVKSAYKWDDTYTCIKGQSSIGPNECFLEESAAIDDYKQRGINVATYGDPSSSRIYREIIMLFVLWGSFQIAMLLYYFVSQTFKNDHDENDHDSTVAQSFNDDMFDARISEFRRHSLFLEVDDNIAVLRRSARSGVIKSNTSGGGIIRTSSRPQSPSNHFGMSKTGISWNDNVIDHTILSRDGISLASSKPEQPDISYKADEGQKHTKIVGFNESGKSLESFLAHPTDEKQDMESSSDIVYDLGVSPESKKMRDLVRKNTRI